MNPKRVKKNKTVKGWMITDPKREAPFAAFFDRDEARMEMKKHPNFYKNDVLLPVTITYSISATKERPNK